MTAPLKLVADIGGTNIRLALIEKSQKPSHIKAYQSADFPLIDHALHTYFNDINLSPQKENLSAAFSVACPPDGDIIKLTNHNWTFSVNKLKTDMAFKNLKIVNDFVAVALSLPSLQRNDLKIIGPTLIPKLATKAVIGPGTGLGVGGIAPYIKDGKLVDWTPLPGEGGHVTLCATNDEEEKIIQFIRHKEGHVSAERLISGFGFTQLYGAICAINPQFSQTLPLKDATPEKISDYALLKKDALCLKTLSQFCAFLGSISGNLALTLGAQGGVYLAGGILPKLGTFFEQSPFRETFEDKGRMRKFNAPIPTYLITADYPAFVGLESLF